MNIKQRIAATISVAALGAAAWAIPAMANPGYGGGPGPVQHVEVSICHATGSPGHWRYETVDDDSIVNDRHELVHNGHALHQDGRDIIPPFTTTDGYQFAGHNWTAAGQAIYANGCHIPDKPDDATGTETVSVSGACTDAMDGTYLTTTVTRAWTAEYVWSSTDGWVLGDKVYADPVSTTESSYDPACYQGGGELPITTPEAPVWHEVCGLTFNDYWEIPEVAGVEYSQTTNEDGSITVTATPTEGFAFPEDTITSWTMKDSLTACSSGGVTPPTLTVDTACAADMTLAVTYPSTPLTAWSFTVIVDGAVLTTLTDDGSEPLAYHGTVPASSLPTGSYSYSVDAVNGETTLAGVATGQLTCEGSQEPTSQAATPTTSTPTATSSPTSTPEATTKVLSAGPASAVAGTPSYTG
ncbi:hypothetical protein [Demequina capsici]|uniref:Ig-like domain-containing protein n=1 Tax=Demequina capsici TaxID=3075620 RepID=A0AA96F6U6_9MICO|nr:hypothetical protein [Demequina sp. OYTSA14]WNM24888.1 hypothetical protein RN606_01690 [Demequina sp. OYTSA14]